MKSHFILFVADQEASTAFYSFVLDTKPQLDVPGMTEFALSSESVLGLMPRAGAARLLGEDVVKTSTLDPAPRSEIYLIVDDPAAFHNRAVRAGARELSSLQNRDWGHIAAYSLDVDGHVLAFAAEIDQTSPF